MGDDCLGVSCGSSSADTGIAVALALVVQQVFKSWRNPLPVEEIAHEPVCLGPIVGLARVVMRTQVGVSSQRGPAGCAQTHGVSSFLGVGAIFLGLSFSRRQEG